MNKFESYAGFESYLDSLGLFHMELGLDRIRSGLKSLGLDRPECAAVQVAGTNGKGSVSAFLAEIAMAHGLKVGLYSSPHFLTPRERIRVNGRMLDQGQWLDLANQVFAAGQGKNLTYFELITLMAGLAFARAGVDLAVFETGLGGRYDAVTALPADLVLMCRIGLDHENVLGRGLEKIAADKAGAMRPGGAVATSIQPAAAMRELEREAERIKAGLFRSSDIHCTEIGPLGPAGPHQIENARLALAGWELLCREKGWPNIPDKAAQGLARTFIPGRLQRVEPGPGGGPEIILDGAHNTDGLRALARSLEDFPPQKRPGAMLFSCMRDKNLSEMKPVLLSLAPGEIYVPGLPEQQRSRDPAELAAELGPRAVPVRDLAGGLALASKNPDLAEKPLLVCGSLYLLAEFFKMRPELLERGGAN